MTADTAHLEDLAGRRLSLQRNCEPKLRGLVETRSRQLGFDDVERSRALHSIDALVWKLTAAGIHLERLWENRESFAMQQLPKALTGTPDPRRFTDKEVAFLTAEFEAYLFQATALLDVAQVHIGCLSCAIRWAAHEQEVREDDQ